MELRDRIEELFQEQVAELTGSAEFTRFEAGRAPAVEVHQLIANVVRSHLRSPKLLAFLYALSPPGKAADALQHNLLEELGVEDEVAHPVLLGRLAEAAGLGSQLARIAAEADQDLKRYVVEPLLYGSLRDVGLAALCEVVAFEYMLSRVATRMAHALMVHRDLPVDALEWFTHHSEVDVRHALEGLDNLVQYIRWYDVAEEDALTILKITFRENVFIKRYFGELAHAHSRRSL